MKVTLAKYGGLAAGIRRPSRVVDTDNLPEQAASELARLVKEAKAVPAAEERIPGRARDAMSYAITIEEGGQSTVLGQSDTTMSPAFDALLNWLERYFAGT